MLFNEPKLLKYFVQTVNGRCDARFSALQRAEIAEIFAAYNQILRCNGFSALQRAEIAEMSVKITRSDEPDGFSALQRAEIAEIVVTPAPARPAAIVSVLFNEPKLLKCDDADARA